MSVAPGEQPGDFPSTSARPIMNLLDIRDELNVVRDFLIVIWLANASPVLAGNGSAACTVANAAREKLEAIAEALGEHMADAAASDRS